MARSGMDKMEELLLRRIQQNENVDSKSSAIAIAKNSGLIKQSGKDLSLTKKGKRSARKVKGKGSEKR